MAFAVDIYNHPLQASVVFGVALVFVLAFRWKASC